MDEIFYKLIWILTYAATTAKAGENADTAVMAANESTARYRDAWTDAGRTAPGRVF